MTPADAVALLLTAFFVGLGIGVAVMVSRGGRPS